MAMGEIRCPSCGGAPKAAAAPDGAYTCAYCGARYSVSVGSWGPGPKSDAASAATPAIAIAIALPVLIVALAGAGAAAYFLRSQPAPPPPAPVAAPVVPAPVAAPVAPAPAPELDPTDKHTVSVAPPPKDVKLPLTAEFAFHSVQKSLSSALYVLGEVTNTSQVTVDNPEILVVLLDAAGKEVGLHNGFAAYDNLAPGESSPVEVLVLDPKPHESMRFETSLRESGYVPTPAAGLELEVDPPTRERFSGIVHTGKVHNKGTEPAQFVQVFVLARDEAGRLLDVDSTYAKGAELLAPGTSARFKTLGTRTDNEPAKFDLVVVGRLAN